jgi:acetoin utilization deacetylase AcuC-like enzyme
MSLILISSERFADHATPPGHPERPARAEVMDAVASHWRERGVEVVAPPEVTHEQLARVHDEAYLARIRESAGRAVAFDPDTYTSPETYDVARLAAGAAVDAVERVMGGTQTSAVALVRPPGHHAERNKAMGFCFYNNVAVAAAHARTLGAKHVAIVDYDVHHGNGTQHIFASDPDVLYVSLHQFPFYPGTGAANEIGTAAGKGFTVNLPIESGAVDDDYRVLFDAVVVPVVEQFKPDLLLVSAGFDAHERDPLGGMRLSTEAFAAMTGDLRRVAESTSSGRIVLVTEGGYDLQAVAGSLDGAVNALYEPTAPAQWNGGTIASNRGRATLVEVKTELGGYWKLG